MKLDQVGENTMSLQLHPQPGVFFSETEVDAGAEVAWTLPVNFTR